MIDFAKSKYSPKAKAFIKKHPLEFKRITLLDGSVRSSKTVNSILKFVDYSYYMGDKGTILISGYSKNTIYNNFLEELFNFVETLGGKYNYNSSNGLLTIEFDQNHIYNYLVAGAGKADSFKSIRGKTLAGWFADELTLHHQLFVKEAFNRLSVENSKIFATTNPDSPNHWLYKDYIKPYLDVTSDRHQDMQDIFEYWHFTLHDNANLPEDFIINISKTYSGAFYQRMIEGQWVVAEGLVYPCFVPQQHTFSPSKRQEMIENYEFSEYIAGIDWGYDHPMTASIIGVTPDFKYYQLFEYYQINKQPEDVIQWLKDMQNRHKLYIDRVFPDSARADNCEKVSLSGYITYNKPALVAPSIDTVRQVMLEDRYKVCEDNTHTLDELATYRYPSEDEKLRNSYKEDAPLKENDDCMDGCLRYPVAGYEMQFNGQRFR